jgi:type IV secretion system protein TrbC
LSRQHPRFSAIHVRNGISLLEKATIGPSFPAYFLPRHGAKRANTCGGILFMQHLESQKTKHRVPDIRLRTLWQALLLSLLAIPAHAQQNGNSPWENAVNVFKTAFTGTIATGLSLVAIVIGGLMFAYGEGQSKRMLAGIVFGIGMAIGAVNFMAWLFPG